MPERIGLLHTMLRANRPLYDVMEGCQSLGLEDYYIGAGCVAQTVWNYQMGNPLLTGISDLDFVYFDADVSPEAEDAVIRMLRERFADCPLRLDIKNQARVHLWYRDRFGYDIPAYPSLEAAIDTWPTTATAIGVRLEGDGLRVYAPFGLDDLLSRTVRPNKAQITEAIYDKKVGRWREVWPSLTVVPW